MLDQIIKVIRLLGLRRAVRMKRRHEHGLAYVRGYAATSCWWALLHVGFLDEVHAHGHADAAAFAGNHQLEPHVFDAVIEYLHGIGLVERRGDDVALTRQGLELLSEPRGLFELLWAYEPCFGNLVDLVRGRKHYGQDVLRSTRFVGIGSGRLCEQLPYPVMRRMLLDHQCRRVLDLGCGDLALLGGLCRLHPEVQGHGIDNDADMVAFDRQQLARCDHDGRLTVGQADMFRLDSLPEGFGPVDAITACDTFHEYLDEPDRLVGLLRDLRGRFPQALFVIGEFCLQDPQWLRRHRTASLEHHLFHELSNQRIGTAQQWRDLFARAGLTIVEEQVYDLIGHGYFALR